MHRMLSFLLTAVLLVADSGVSLFWLLSVFKYTKLTGSASVVGHKKQQLQRTEDQQTLEERWGTEDQQRLKEFFFSNKNKGLISLRPTR